MSKKESKEAKAPKVENVKVSPFSNDTTFLVSAPFGAGGTGTTVYGTYGDNGEHSYYYYQDNGDLDKITLDKGSSRYTWLDDLIKDQVKNNAKYPSWFTRLFPGVASKQKFGGNMNYASYLEGGGAAPLNAAPLVSKEDIAEIITAALNGTGETKQKANEALQEMMQDASLAPLVEQVMSEMGIPALKCGGRVKKKEMGSKLVKAEKAKCGCVLKKVGGRLIEVDTCTGLPIHRNGGQVKKYQNAAGAIQRADDGSYYFKDGPASRTYTATEAKERLGAVRHNGSYYYRSPEGRIYTLESTPLNWAQSAGWAEMKKNDAGAYVLHPDVLAGLGYQKRENGSWGYGPAPEAQPQAPAPLAPQAPAAPAGQLPPAAPAPAAPSAPASPAPASTGPGLFTGDLKSYGARKQWVTDNAEYLKSQGWDDARIAGYKGSARDNIDLARQIGGLLAWKDKQAAVTPKEQSTAAQPASIARTESDGMTNEALLALDASKALTTLSRPDFQRWMDLNSYLQGRNASLIYNGTRYANEEAYNKAVNEETLKTAPLFDLEAALNTRGKRKRNALYADFKTAMEKHVANNPLYQGPAALSQEQLSATSFKNDKKLNYSDYLK